MMLQKESNQTGVTTSYREAEGEFTQQEKNRQFGSDHPCQTFSEVHDSITLLQF